MALARRQLGYTEANWCLAVVGGTGITVSAFLFGRSLSKFTVQTAVEKLLTATPFLNSQIVGKEHALFMELDKDSEVVVADLPNPEAESGDEGGAAEELWLRIVDAELNIPFPTIKPISVLQVHLYRNLQRASSLVILRMHTCAADMNSTSTLGTLFLTSLQQVVEAEQSEAQDIDILLKKIELDRDSLDEFQYYPAIENAIPKGGAHKPFWAHGTDVLGYGLASRRHANLQFLDTETPRRSRLIRSALSKEATGRLLQSCKENSADLYGALSAAGLKSAAIAKKAGTKGEHYGIAVLYNCRSLLDPPLPEEAMGFYQSALMKTTQTGEDHEFWKLAVNCTKDFQDAIRNRKHFTDMGNLNLLMVQAIQHPNLTPASSMRTALYSVLRDPVIESTPERAVELLRLKDFVSASSAHGVGPCVAMFSFLRDGALHISFVYCDPLFAPAQIQILVDSIMSYLRLD